MRSVKVSRKTWVLALAAGIVSIAACNSSRVVDERVGSQASALFTNGIACSNANQCESNFCVDGVCCNTACGGGARDLQACSNVYGQVSGLTDGTCTPLKEGDACGSLVSVNPCTWRGTIVKNGGNCPNPPSNSAACFPCNGPENCTGAFPVCLAGSCVACNGDFNSGATSACPSTAPACTSQGSCVQCTSDNKTACGGTTPSCNLNSNTCAACNGDFGSGAPRACPTQTLRACIAGGSCAACSATNATACTGTTPTCDLSTHTCTGCNGDFASGATQACPTSTAPFCFGTGASAGSCGKCTGDTDCTGNPAGSVCNTTTGTCGVACSDDNGCTAGQWCAAGACVPKTPNGQPIPNIPPVNGTCTTDNGTRVCISGACSTADNLCGLPNGASCGPPPNNTVCRSGICNATDNQCGLPTGSPCSDPLQCRSSICPPSGLCGSCNTDGDCGAPTSGQICDTLQKVCKAGCRGTGGNGCPGGQVCTSTNDTEGRCVQCLDDGACGGANSGMVCNPSNVCQPGCRGSGGNACPLDQVCSSLDGTIGTCTLPDGGVVPDGGTGSDGGLSDGGLSDGGRDAGNDGGIADAGRDAGGDAGRDGGNVSDGGNVGDGGGVFEDSGTGTDGGTKADGGQPVIDDGVLEGGGFACSATSSPASSGSGALLFFMGAGAMMARRRRRSGS